MKSFRLLLLPFLLISLVLAGCWDRQEIEERVSVVAMALDRAKEKKGMLRLSVQIPIPKKIAGSGAGQAGTGGKEAVRVMSSTGHTVAEATRNLQKRLNQELFYGHTRVIAVSEELAREGIETVVDAFRRTPQIRRLLWPVVVKGEALHLLETNPKLEQIPIMYLLDMMDNNAKVESLPDITLGTFFINLSDSAREPGMNMIEATQDEMRWIGLAVFEDSRMKGYLPTDEVWTLMQIREEKLGGPIDVLCDQKGKMITFRGKTIRTKKKYQKQGDNIAVTVNVRLEGDIVESQCKIDFTNQPNISKVEALFQTELERRAHRLLNRLQKEIKQDMFDFGRDIRAKHPEWWDPDKWEKRFPQLEMRVNYDVLIRRTGMELK